MAITIDNVFSGMVSPMRFDKNALTGEAAGIMSSYFAVVGLPGQGSVGSPGLAGSSLSGSVAGCFTLQNASGSNNCYLAGLSFSSAANVPGFMVIDRMWHNSGIAVTTTTAQTINSTTLPARDEGGTTDGVGVEVALEVTTATTNAGVITNCTLSYTNSDGVAGRTASPNPNIPATAVATTFIPFLLQGSDRGVRSIQSITLGTSLGGGAVSLVMYRRIYEGGEATGAGACVHVADYAKTRLVRVYNNSCLHLVGLLAGTAAGRVYGSLGITHMTP